MSGDENKCENEHACADSFEGDEFELTKHDLVNKCSYKTRVAVTAWVFAHLVGHALKGGSFRHLIYNRLQFGPDAYEPLYNHGGMVISNSFRVKEEELADHHEDGEIEASASPVNVTTGERMTPEQASSMHSRLASGTLAIEIPPEVEREMTELGITAEDLKEMLMKSAKKALS